MSIVEYRKKDIKRSSPSAEETRHPDPSYKNYITACAPDQTGYLPFPSWRFWNDFPSKKLIDDAKCLNVRSLHNDALYILSVMVCDRRNIPAK